ncbi:MAG: tRNA uridine-5-carboxymethylaminomethyl(34) synthesis GTPase MnmE, partial [Candidatus Babeliales bacterium]
FTGQDTIEITCHNNPFIIESILAQAIAHGARIAHAGEFSQRAFLHGKIDLTQAEAINDLIHANTQQALKQSLAQVEGSLSSWIMHIQQELLKARAYCEASFEFIDEEIEFSPQINQNIQDVLKTIARLKKTFDQQNQIREGIRITLIGSVNAGKSSLFNALLGKDRSIVTNIAGTTRDVIEAGVYRNGTYWTLVDTAGLRQAHDIVEKEGIKRSFQEAKKTDIIILVYDASRTLSDEEQTIYSELHSKYDHKIITVANKWDLIESHPHGSIHSSQQTSKITHHEQVNPFAPFFLSDCGPIVSKDQTKNFYPASSHNAQSIQNIELKIEQKITSMLLQADSPFLLNKRQFNILLALEKQLEKIVEMLNSSAIAYELLSYELRSALEHISELTGKSIDEAGMDMIFKQFCVGK